MTDFSSLFARGVALFGDVVVALRHRQGAPSVQAVGGSPVIPEAKAQGIPTLKMPTGRGWPEGHAPVAAPGLKVNAFARGLKPQQRPSPIRHTGPWLRLVMFKY